jgi:hypothetical protein
MSKVKREASVCAERSKVDQVRHRIVHFKMFEIATDGVSYPVDEPRCIPASD